jgi:hypothetical protein
MIAWSDFASTAETGDIALFSGESMISDVIKLAEGGSNWSHIGMFVRLKNGQLCIWESTNYDGQVDLLSKRAKGGVRLVDAETAIRGYIRLAEGAMVVARRLYIDTAVLELVNPVGHLPRFRKFMQTVSNLPYERNPADLVRASEFGRWLQLLYAWESKDSYFCSELVADSYIQLGLFPDDSATNATKTSTGARHSSLYTPMDFAQESQDLPFLYDTRTGESMVDLGPHLQLVFPDAGADPLETAPRRMPNPRRPSLRMSMTAPSSASRSPFALY